MKPKTIHATLRLNAAMAAIGMCAWLLAGCPAPTIVPPTNSAVTLDVEARIVGTPDATRIEALHIWPRGAGPELQFDESSTFFFISNPDGRFSDPVQAVPQLKGIEPKQALDFYGSGPASVSLRPLTGARDLVIEDGFGNSLRIAEIAANFEILEQGTTNLSERWTLVVPMSGSTMDLARAEFHNVPPFTGLSISVSSATGNRQYNRATGPSGADVVFSDLAPDPVSAVSRAVVAFTRVVP